MATARSNGNSAAIAAALEDVKAARREYLFEPPRAVSEWLKGKLNDPRDIPLLYALFDITVCVVPSAVALFVLPPSHWLGLAHLVMTYAIWGARFILAFHYSSHRSLFTKDAQIFNHVAEWLLSPLFGICCGVYKAHHCVMHHGEDNGGLDLSSTEMYQRDNVLHFLAYWARFAVLSVVELPKYCLVKGRYMLFGKVVTGMLTWLAAVMTLHRVNPVATLWVLVIPYFVSSFLLMFGNWSQHIFVDPAKPECDYTLTYNCVAAKDNQQTFNDGYHVIHHVNSRIHWSEMPQKFIETIEKHGDEGALTFKGISFFEIGGACMLGKLGWLADHVLPNTGEARSHEETVALLKERLRPVKRGLAKAEKEQ